MSSGLESVAAGGAGDSKRVTYEGLKATEVKVAAIAIPRIHATIDWESHNQVVVKQAIEKPDDFLVAKDEAGEVVGYAEVVPKDSGAYHLKYIAIDKSKERKGLGTGLMMAALERVRALGADIFMANFRGNKPGLEEFYKKVGSMAKTADIVTDFDVIKTGMLFLNGDPRHQVTYRLKKIHD